MIFTLAGTILAAHDCACMEIVAWDFASINANGIFRAHRNPRAGKRRGVDTSSSRVVDSARQVRQFLEELGLESFVKTTGGKGLHIVVPVDRRYDWDEVKSFCKGVAELIEQAAPARYTSNMSKAARPGKIFIDYLRNGRGATAIVPFSTRARPGAPISVPLSWAELTARISSEHFTIRNIQKRLQSLKRDPWERIGDLHQSLVGPMNALRALRSR